MSSRVLILRRADSCRACGARLAAGTRAHWNAVRREVTCLQCLERTVTARTDALELPVALERGHAGASAEREHARRRHNREARAHERHPHIGGVLLALRGAPQHERAFAQGGAGERAVGGWLERRTAKSGTVVLHDRRMPGGLGNIDHLAIAPRGVYVVDAKAVRGRVRVTHPLLGKPRLLVAGRDCTKFADGLDRQIGAVRRALAEVGRPEIRVYGALCFTKAGLPLLGGAQIRGHRLHYRAALARKLNRRGPLARGEIAELARALATALPPA